jgi:hypothetical protein
LGQLAAKVTGSEGASTEKEGPPMSKFSLPRPTASGAVAFLALLLALAGSAYAGSTLAKNSVGTKQLKNGAVTTKKIANGAVTKLKINTSGLSVPFAAKATNAGHATSADGLTTLPSGDSESGTFSGGDSGSGWIGVAINYPRPLSAPIADTHIIDVHGTSATHCPGAGQADAGYLCLYNTDTLNTNDGTDFYSNDGYIFPTSFGKLGVVLYWFTSGTGYVGGVWTVTAP